MLCCNCKRQTTNFYKLNGERYGQVGTIQYNCGAEIHSTDSDNIVEHFDTTTTFKRNTIGKYHINYLKTYKLENENFIKVKEKTGFDIFNEYLNPKRITENLFERFIGNFI